ncbi:MAG: hypothetical protein N2578_06260, partial [Bdellovibrionaceae bacterium]|nr:hypothetical protein [Pseudobdellovibrionaceae bacterium]
CIRDRHDGDAATIEDLRWLARRIANLTEDDFREIVSAAEFPPEIEELVFVKLLYRAANLIELLDLPAPESWRKHSLEVNTPGGLVRDGKVMREFVPGWPQRWAHGDRESPFKDGDFGRYLSVKLRSSIITTALAALSQKLQVLDMDRLVERRRQDIENRIRDHIRNRPNEPLYQNVEAWGGVLGGFNVSANRNVTTGTYYGSQAAIQLVDNLSVGANLGIFMTLDGVPKSFPSVGGNVMLMRDYTHVRPLMSMREGTKVAWKNLAVPKYMAGLAQSLEAKAEPQAPHPVDQFLKELRDGEVFTITDSIGLVGNAQVAAPLDVLMGIVPLGFANSIAMGMDASRVILRQVSIMRTGQGLQIFVREQNGRVFGLNFDLNLFVNILSLRNQSQKSDIRTDAFVIDYNPEFADYLDKDGEQKFLKDFLKTRSHLQPALAALMRGNDPELLYTSFQHRKFQIEHELKNNEFRNKLLFIRGAGYAEDHLLKILYPRDPEAPDLEPENEMITIFRNRKAQMVGYDLFAAARDFLEAFLNNRLRVGYINISHGDDPNPATSPYGRAYWRVVNTEGELGSRPDKAPDIAIVQHVWAGWHLSRKKFFRLLEEVKKKFEGTRLRHYRLVEPEAFYQVKAVDFYRVTASMTVFPAGLEKIRYLVLQPDADGKPAEKARYLDRLFQKISEKIGRRARANDAELYREILLLLGNGNEAAGKEVLRQQCESEKSASESSGQPTGGWRNGTYFDCLAPWLERLLQLSERYPQADRKAQIRWSTDVLFVLEEVIPLPTLLRYIGENNYLLMIKINGFRSGDEDGDLEFFANTLGDPADGHEYANGLVNMYANRTRISPVELDRTLGSFR